MLDQLSIEALADAKKARAKLTKVPGRLIGRVAKPLSGDYMENYAQCLLSRQIDVFDDALFLLENERIASACSISRAFIETYAVAKLFGGTVAKVLATRTGQDSVDECLKIILRFTNSSRIKEMEQKKVSKGGFSLTDYQFTEQATERMVNSMATSEHVLNALRVLFKEEMEHTGRKESQFEIVYDSLSEWVHPSQTSIYHQYVPETHYVPTSTGVVHIYDSAKLNCARALHFVTDSENVHVWLLELAAELSLRGSVK